MKYRFEFIEHRENLPFKLFVNSVVHVPYHWHKELEIVFVLRGSVRIQTGNDVHILGENGLLLVNAMDIHKIDRTDEDNALLTLQVNPDIFGSNGEEIQKWRIECNSAIGSAEDEAFERIRRDLAQLAWELNKRTRGYRQYAAGRLQLLLGHLLRHFPLSERDAADEMNDSDLQRLNRILEFVDLHYMEKITLNDMAEREHLSFYYFSHFFKKKIGLPFQKYLAGVRLEKAAAELLETKKSVLDISTDCGFANVKIFNKSFKEKYGETPTGYRGRHGLSDAPAETDSLPFQMKESDNGLYIQVDTVSVLDALFRYLPADRTEAPIRGSRPESREVRVDARREGDSYAKHWTFLTTAGRAAEGLRSDWRRQLAETRRELGFRYIRFHGIFNDEMMVYREKGGKAVYHWGYVDELFDYLLGIGLRPFVELGFMPGALRRSEETIFWWKGNIAPPKDTGRWTELVRRFVAHCVERYGAEEVERWYFEVWNEPDLPGVCWAGTREEYFEFYAATARAVKSVSSRLKVGGPALNYISLWEGDWMEAFLAFCAESRVSLDFFSFHSYSEYWRKDREAGGWSELMPPSFQEETIARAASGLRASPIPDAELHLTEWNYSLYPRFLPHDTAFMAPFIIRLALRTIGAVQSLGFWTFTDIIEEHGAGPSPFHGGFGLVTAQGLKKPSYYAFALLNKLGDRIVDRGDDYIVTRRGEEWQVLAYRYVHLDKLFASGEWSGLSATHRYGVFEERDDLALRIRIEGLNGDYQVTRYRLDREHGSVFDEWVAMGAPRSLSEDELAYLRGRAGPAVRSERIRAEGDYVCDNLLPPHGVQLTVIRKLHGADGG